jgi:GNAT superfamily N-acetyltransferase
MSTRTQLYIRDARRDEWDAIRELTLAAYAEYAAVMTPGAWASLDQAVRGALATDGAVERIVAEQGGTLVGSVQLYPPAVDVYNGAVAGVTWPELRLLVVLPGARGQGVATALINECIARARRSGATDLGLHTSPSMQAAVQMYERMGFVRAADYDFHPDGGEVVTAYRRNLTSESHARGTAPAVNEKE